MICPECGKETPDNQPRCINCGANLTGATRLPTGNIQQKPGKPSPGSEGSKPPAGADAGDKIQIVPGGSREKPGIPPRKMPQKPPVSGPGTTQLPPTGKRPEPGKPPSGGEIKKAPPAAGAEGRTQVVPGGTQGKPGMPPGQAQKKPPAPESAGKESTDEELELLRKALAGRYEVTRKLGSGGMASVYLAREIALDREVAIKLLPRSFLRDKQFITRFKSEAQVAANLEHPHIVRIYRISEEEDLVYFVMSYIPGGSISDRIKKQGPLPVDEIVQWGMDVSSALGYAHDHGVIHRDLKPDNIMLDKGKRAVVMDYGIARAGQGTGLTQTGAVIGTPQFMSPEQARGIEIDSRSDIYSMGLVLYEMATGTLPFKAADAASLMYMHVHETPEPPDVRNEKVPAWLRDIILKCLAKNPDDRFGHAKELRLALAEHKAPELTEKTVVQKRAAEKKSKAGLWIAAAAIVIAAAAAGWFWWNSQQKAFEQAVRPTGAGTQQSPQAQAPPAPVQPQVSADDLTFQQAEMTNTKQAFLTYIEKYPEGSHAGEAKEKIADFEQEEKAATERREQSAQQEREERARIAKEQRAEEARRQAEADRMDDEAYSQTETANTVQAYTTYLQSYPLGRNVGKARLKLAALSEKAAEEEKARAEELTRRDDEAFRLTLNTNTKASYSTYLISFPAGLHKREANEKIAAIEKKEAFDEKIRVELSALSINMAKIPAGSFQMGSNNGDKNEKPVRTVALSGFSIGTTEVTQAQYMTIMNDNPSFHKLDDNCPVEKITRKDAITFCNRLSEKLGLEPCYNLSTGKCDFSRNGFRLPTEAEWEYACRGGTGSDYNTGNGESALSRAGWYARNSAEKTHPVGQRTPNAVGLYDMHGNVSEWTNDWYSDRSYEIDKNENPTGVPSGKERVLRGGSWLDWPKDCTSTKRRDFDPKKNYSDIGFRIVRR